MNDPVNHAVPATPTTPGTTLRPYCDADEPSWLRCRVLSFLGTQYYDDVKDRRTPFDLPSVQLVAVRPGAGPTGAPSAQDEVIGILDVEIDGEAATIDTVAVHPDHARSGIATALLDAALPILREQGVRTLDAWTREDAAARAWYERHGFVEQHRYVHVHKEWDDDAEGFTSPAPLTRPVRALAHAPIDQEAALRTRFRRVYVCRHYLRPVDLAN